MPPNQSDDVSDGRVLLDAQLLKHLRKKLGLSQEALADACSDSRLCLSLASIKRAEAGKPVLYRTARHLARFFDTELALLLVAPHRLPTNTVQINHRAERHVMRSPTLDRRRSNIEPSVIYFTVDAQTFNSAAQRLVVEAGARTITSLAGAEFAVVFGAPAHRWTDALAALKCATQLKSTVTPFGSLVIRRRAVKAIFALPNQSNLDCEPTAGNAIFVETALARQLAALAKFECCNEPDGIERFLQFFGAIH